VNFTGLKRADYTHRLAVCKKNVLSAVLKAAFTSSFAVLASWLRGKCSAAAPVKIQWRRRHCADAGMNLQATRPDLTPKSLIIVCNPVLI
jgi:hypothetical protein